MKFKQIVILDDVQISAESIKDLQNYSEKSVSNFSVDPVDGEETKKRLVEADCVLVSWRAILDKEIIADCPELRFVCICGTNAKGIDLEECARKNIVVSNVIDYGDEGVVEYIIFQLLSIVRGAGEYKWKNYPAEINGKTLGIVGLGVVGKLLAQAALGLNMKVVYNSRTRNSQWEERGLVFLEKQELFQKSDFISLHTPKDVQAITRDDFDLMTGKILFNTTIGKAFEEDDFKKWIKEENNFAVMDGTVSPDFQQQFKGLDRVIISEKVSGRTLESISRLSQKVLDNIIGYLEGKVVNRIN